MKIELNELLQLLKNFFNEELDETLELDESSKLFGGDGILDSMALVNLLVELEEYLEDNFKKSIILADEKVMSRRTSPFSRVSNLLEYLNEKLIEHE